MGTLISTPKCDYYSEQEINGDFIKKRWLDAEDDEEFFNSEGFERLDDCEDPPIGKHKKLTLV